MLTLNIFVDINDDDNDENKMYSLLVVNNFLYEAIIINYLK